MGEPPAALRTGGSREVKPAGWRKPHGRGQWKDDGPLQGEARITGVAPTAFQPPVSMGGWGARRWIDKH